MPISRFMHFSAYACHALGPEQWLTESPSDAGYARCVQQLPRRRSVDLGNLHGSLVFLQSGSEGFSSLTDVHFTARSECNEVYIGQTANVTQS